MRDLVEALILGVGGSATFSGALLTWRHRHDAAIAAAQDEMMAYQKHTMNKLQHDLNQAQDSLKRCPITPELPTGVHRCVEEAGHTGVHTDDRIAWYGNALFPAPVKEAV